MEVRLSCERAWCGALHLVVGDCILPQSAIANGIG